MPTVISVENLSKSYRLGQIGSGTLTNDLRAWWAKARGRSNPLLKIGQQDHGSRTGEEVWALRDVSFQVEQGEVLGVIGRNGAGKSTLLKILSRVTAPTSGLVKVKGRIASLLEVGTGFHPELTGRENIYLNGAILGMRRDEVKRKFDEIVAFAEVEKFIDTPVKRYSSGMYVRLAFSVAAHLDPDTLIVDEVLAVGDGAFQKKCLGKMGEVAGEGRTVLFVSHNMAAVRSLCSRGLVLREGHLDLYGDVVDAIDHYQSIRSKVSEKSSNKAVYFDHVRIESQSSNKINSGESFLVCGRVKIQEPLNGFDMYCIIQDGDGDNVVHAHADHRDLPQLKGPGTFDLEIRFPGLWLKPGAYSLHLKLIPSILAKGHVRFVSDTVIIDVTADIHPEMLLGTLTPSVEWKQSRCNF